MGQQSPNDSIRGSERYIGAHLAWRIQALLGYTSVADTIGSDMLTLLPQGTVLWTMAYPARDCRAGTRTIS
jgi:hypothetical protein